MLAYRILRKLLSLAVRVFYRRVEVVGLEHIPKNGAVVFCGNHPNSLLDPILITVSCGRIAHFAAKDILFRNPIVARLLRVMGAVPIMRRKDHVGEAVDNSSAFEALFEVLGSGRCMGIFPEGLSHNDSHLQSLKTGAARIALGAVQAHGNPVVLVPCGLNYMNRHRFRSSILVQYGEPIRIGDARLAEFAQDETSAVRALTDELDTAMRELTVNADDWDTLRVLDGVRRLYQPEKISLAERVELARRFNAVYPTVRDDPTIVDLFSKVRDYQERLAIAQLNDREIQRDIPPRVLFMKTVGHLIWLGIWLPLAVIGAGLHAPMALFLGWAGERWAPKKDKVGATKFVLGFFLIQAAYIGVFVLAGLYWGWTIALALLILTPVSGYATLRVSERFASVKRVSSRFFRVFRLAAEVKALRHQRTLLALAIETAVDRFRPRDMAPLFPKPPDEDYC